MSTDQDGRITYGFNCSRPPAEDNVVRDKGTGTARVVKRCPGCLAVEHKVRGGWPFEPPPSDAP
jgi:hypothetical protein